MHLSSLIAVFSFALASVAIRTPVEHRADTDSGLNDVKLDVGLDGVTSIASTVGTTLEALENRVQGHGRKRTVGGVYICTDTNWGGKCGYAVQPLNECVVLGSPWRYGISSFGPDKCTTCVGYGSTDCRIHEPENESEFRLELTWVFNYPGDPSGGINVDEYPWNDNIGSFKCSSSC